MDDTYREEKHHLVDVFGLQCLYGDKGDEEEEETSDERKKTISSVIHANRDKLYVLCNNSIVSTKHFGYDLFFRAATEVCVNPVWCETVMESLFDGNTRLISYLKNRGGDTCVNTHPFKSIDFGTAPYLTVQPGKAMLCLQDLYATFTLKGWHKVLHDEGIERCLKQILFFRERFTEREWMIALSIIINLTCMVDEEKESCQMRYNQLFGWIIPQLFVHLESEITGRDSSWYNIACRAIIEYALENGPEVSTDILKRFIKALRTPGPCMDSENQTNMIHFLSELIYDIDIDPEKPNIELFEEFFSICKYIRFRPWCLVDACIIYLEEVKESSPSEKVVSLLERFNTWKEEARVSAEMSI